MLADFLIANRGRIIAGARARVAKRTCPKPNQVELANGIRVFLDQLITVLRLAEASEVASHDQMAKSARLHGHDLFDMGFTVAQVVHDYGDVCQAITELASAQVAPITGDEFQMLNLCLDNAIAGAVTEYAAQRERAIEAQGTERLAMLAHELRNMLNAATLSFESIRSGRVAPSGSTADVHARSLLGLRDLIDRSLAEVRLEAGLRHVERISVAQLLEELEIPAVLEAKAGRLHFTVNTVDRSVGVEADRASIAAIVSNLLQNAFKFTPADGTVSLTARATGERVFFDVEDQCGGLPPGKAEDLFRPFEQRGTDRRGLGLGLTICLRAAKANGGELHVRDLPGRGCIFTLELPQDHGTKHHAS